MGLEGIMSKRLGSRYRSGRTSELAQVQKPRCSGGDTRGRRGLGTIGMTDRRLPELIGICVVLQVTQCARSFGEGAGGDLRPQRELGNNAAGLAFPPCEQGRCSYVERPKLSPRFHTPVIGARFSRQGVKLKCTSSMSGSSSPCCSVFWPSPAFCDTTMSATTKSSPTGNRSAVSQNLRGSPQCPNNISDEARFPNKMPRPAGD
jgi:hypothetical protein